MRAETLRHKAPPGRISDKSMKASIVVVVGLANDQLWVISILSTCWLASRSKRSLELSQGGTGGRDPAWRCWKSYGVNMAEFLLTVSRA